MAVPERFLQPSHVKVLAPRAPSRPTHLRPVNTPAPSSDTVPAYTVHIDDDDPRERWFLAQHRERAGATLGWLEQALERGDEGRARRLRATYLGVVHADRLAWARHLAQREGLRLDPTGRGPVLHRPTLYLRDRLPWYVVPLDTGFPPGPACLPERAARTRTAWKAAGAPFDVCYLADEPAGSSPVPCHSLIGVISPDGRKGEWFVLDRWGS